MTVRREAVPIYEYECHKCGERFEQFRALRDSDSELKCPECGAKHPIRVFSTFATGSQGQDSCAPGAHT